MVDWNGRKVVFLIGFEPTTLSFSPISAIHFKRCNNQTLSLLRTLKKIPSEVGVEFSGNSAISHVISYHENNSDCNTHKAFYFIASFFSSAFFLGVVVLSVDRFLAIHLRFRYQDLNSFLNPVIYCRKMRHIRYPVTSWKYWGTCLYTEIARTLTWSSVPSLLAAAL